MYVCYSRLQVHRFHPRGTWMSSIGIVAQTLSETGEEEQHVLVLSTEPSSFEEICQLKPKEQNFLSTL